MPKSNPTPWVVGNQVGPTDKTPRIYDADGMLVGYVDYRWGQEASRALAERIVSAVNAKDATGGEGGVQKTLEVTDSVLAELSPELHSPEFRQGACWALLGVREASRKAGATGGEPVDP